MKTITRFDIVLSATVNQFDADRTIVDGTIEGVEYISGADSEAATLAMTQDASFVEWDHILTGAKVTVEEINAALALFYKLDNGSMVDYLITNPKIRPVRAYILNGFRNPKELSIRLYLEPKN